MPRTRLTDEVMEQFRLLCDEQEIAEELDDSEDPEFLVAIAFEEEQAA